MTEQINTVDGTEVRNEVIVTMDGREIDIPLASLSLTMQSTDTEVLNAIRPLLREREGFDILDSNTDFTYSIRKSMAQATIFVYPKPRMRKT